MDCSPPSSSVHGISQARILKWVAISFSRGPSWPKIKPVSPALASLPLSHHLSELEAVYFSYLIALATTSSTLLNRSGESGHPCFVHSFRGKTFSHSLLNAMLAVGFSYMAFFMMRWFPSIPCLLRVVVCFFFFKSWRDIELDQIFSASIEIIMSLLPFILFAQCFTLTDFSKLKYSSIPEINSTWSWGLSF